MHGTEEIDLEQLQVFMVEIGWEAKEEIQKTTSDRIGIRWNLGGRAF